MRLNHLNPHFIIALMLIPICLMACSAEHSASFPKGGKMLLPISGTSNSGVDYRLSTGEFTITGGATPVSISASDYLNQTTAYIDLEAGDYSIGLADGWILERLDGSNWVPVTANLTSPNPVPFTIAANQIAPVVFVFSTDGQNIPVGNGTLALSIDVVEQDSDAGVVFDCNLPPVGADGQPKPSGVATGISVLDWAGYQGAVTYTLDDANSSQIENWAALAALNVPMTFFLQTGKAEASHPVWQEALALGHELGNHTQNHGSPSESEIDLATAFIENTFGISPLTFAIPNGDTGYLLLLPQRFFLARGIGAGNILPNGNNDPFNLPSYIPPTNAPTSQLNSLIDAARWAGAWQVLLVHGFTGGTDGAYAPIDLNAFIGNVAYAKATGDMWIDTFSKVGAYWLGQKLIADSTPAVTGNSQTWTWELPDNFPSNQCLRISVTGGAVSQNGQTVAWDSHGYYQISLDEGSLTLAQ
ncbi:MAG: polysaccharide deacetylase family protein [Deltaproteobacteria bacterium]|nr:polysaccharide deacetylase family protein [Deltaproteobacteria bacterium]